MIMGTEIRRKMLGVMGSSANSLIFMLITNK